MYLCLECVCVVCEYTRMQVWGSNFHPQAWQHEPLPTEPLKAPYLTVFILQFEVSARETTLILVEILSQV